MGGGSLRGRGPVVPPIAGAQQAPKSGSRDGGGSYPGEQWDKRLAEVRCRRVAGIPVVVDPVARPKGGYSGVLWVRRLEASVAEGRGSHRVWVWRRAVAGIAGGAESPAERSSGSADLQAGCSFIRSWCGEAFPDLRVYRAVFLSVPGALPQSGVSPASPQGLWVSSRGLRLCLCHHLGSLL
jgi:hypothetical protein